MRKQDFIDASLGDPLLPLTKVAHHAFKQSMATANQYMFNSPYGLSAHPARNESLANITKYFTAHGIKTPGWTGLTLDSLLPTGGGTTEAYELIIQHLANDVGAHNSRKQRAIKPVILMPTPTYGFFMDQPRAHDIEVVKVPLDLSKGGALSPRELHDAISKVNEEGKRVVAFYMPNPHNPLGYIREEAETRALAKIIKFHNREYQKADEKWLVAGGKVKRKGPKKSKDHIDEIMRPYKRHHWQGPAARIRIIDDMVYDGLTYSDKKAFSFSQIEECFADTFTLFGLSKVGLTNLRAGLVIGDNKDILALADIQRNYSYSPPAIVNHALETYFSDEQPYAGWRDKHLEKQNEIYRFNSLFMKALVNGLDDVPQASAQDIKRMTNLLVRHKGGSHNDARTRLKTPLKHIKIITTPESGFFHLLDLSGLKDSHFHNDFTAGKRFDGYTDTFERYAKGQAMDNSHIIFEHFGLKFAAGAWAGSDMEDMLARVTFAMKPAQIIEFVNRLDKALGAFKLDKHPKPKPKINCHRKI